MSAKRKKRRVKVKKWCKIERTKYPPKKLKSLKQVLYFKILLLIKIDVKWEWIVCFDTYHKGKKYAHKHIRTSLKPERKILIAIPFFRNFKQGIRWAIDQDIRKNWKK